MSKRRISFCVVAAMALATASLLLLAAAPATPTTAAPTPAAVQAAPLFGPFKWKSSAVLVSPVSDETHRLVLGKDPTVVYYGDKWHVYAFVSDRLDGKWTPLPEADTYSKPFAGINNVTFEEGVAPWTKDISHGELIRDGYDETMTIDLKNLRLLYQGRDPAIRTSYGLLPYRLGLLKLE